MKHHRLSIFRLMLILAIAMLGMADDPPEVPYQDAGTDEKQVKRTVGVVPDEPPKATHEIQLERAESMIAKYYDNVGKRLTATLADDEIPNRQRVQAARRLGIMKYPPGIETLIRNNGLTDATAVSEDWAVAFPCVLALREYGDAAVPEIVEAWLDAEEKSADRSRLISAIGANPTRQTALIYAKGLGTDIRDKVRLNRLKELIKGLSQ